MGLLKNLLENVKKDKEEFKRKFREAQEQDRINRIIEERRKSPNRRELEAYKREKEEERITKELRDTKRKRNVESWNSGNRILNEKKIFNHKSILKQDNLFMGKKKKNGDNIFKW